MDGNQIGDKGAIAMGECIAFHPSLKILHLNNCRIGLKGVKSLLQSLKTNRTLESLGISHSTVEKEGSTFVSDFLSQNQKIRSINLGFSGIDDSDAQKIAKGIQSNPQTNIQSVILDGNELILPSTLQFLREVIADATINRHCRTAESNQSQSNSDPTKQAGKSRKFRDYLRGALLSHKKQKGALDKNHLDPAEDPEIIAKREKLEKLQVLLLEKDNRVNSPLDFKSFISFLWNRSKRRKKNYLPKKRNWKRKKGEWRREKECLEQR